MKSICELDLELKYGVVLCGRLVSSSVSRFTGMRVSDFW